MSTSIPMSPEHYAIMPGRFVPAHNNTHATAIVYLSPIDHDGIPIPLEVKWFPISPRPVSHRTYDNTPYHIVTMDLLTPSIAMNDQSVPIIELSQGPTLFVGTPDNTPIPTTATAAWTYIQQVWARQDAVRDATLIDRIRQSISLMIHIHNIPDAEDYDHVFLHQGRIYTHILYVQGSMHEEALCTVDISIPGIHDRPLSDSVDNTRTLQYYMDENTNDPDDAYTSRLKKFPYTIGPLYDMILCIPINSYSQHDIMAHRRSLGDILPDIRITPR